MEEIRNLRRRIARLQEQRRIAKLTPPEQLTYYGGWSIGYLEGKLAILEDRLFDLEADEQTYQIRSHDG